MKKIDETYKVKLIDTFNMFLKEKDYVKAINSIAKLIMYQKDFLDDVTCLEDQISLMSLSNQLYRHEHIDESPIYYTHELFDLIIQYKDEDLQWKTEKLKELFDLAIKTRDYIFLYQVAFVLIPYFRSTSNEEELKYCYKELMISIHEIKEDVANYAKRIDHIELDINQEIKQRVYYQLRHNPVEKTNLYQSIQHNVQHEVTKKIGKNSGMGFCHVYWAEKRRILKEKYSIDWHSPSDLNDAHFD